MSLIHRRTTEPTRKIIDATKAEGKKREEDELLCRGHILNTLTDRLYDLYSNLTSPREIWTALQTTYENEKRGIDKFLSLQYFEFKMIDTNPIMDQIHELQILVPKLSDLEVKIPDALQIGAILSKLPSSWNNYRKKILHSTDKLTVEQFRTHLQIESETRARDAVVQASSSIVNVVRVNGKSRNSEKVDAVESSSKGLVAMISTIPSEMVKELNMATTTTKNQDRWLDSGATIHVCHDKNMFKTYSEVKDSEKVLMGNHVTAEVEGKGTVEINFTSGQKLTLLNVFHVPQK
ncbi:uncharacterized protein LOC132062298 [Lycium ferocissimum]|uniref:uncharacterized protein LOC132062298 n=1 Tax=Lycium ferocissimum TaxID=112874 RepID=UPI002815C411|nr:uncharacterized protein LOC132062298 [Lycium ferocissimum]